MGQLPPCRPHIAVTAVALRMQRHGTVDDPDYVEIENYARYKKALRRKRFAIESRHFG